MSSEMVTNLKEAGQSIVSTRRPWTEFFQLSLPSSLSEATNRISVNLTRFTFNYILILLMILPFTFIYHPFAIMLFLLLLAAWPFLFFSRDSSEPLTLFNLVTLDDRFVFLALALFTVVAIAFTGVWLSVIVSVAVATVVVCLHGALRSTDEGVVDDYESPYGHMLGDPADGGYTRV